MESHPLRMCSVAPGARRCVCRVGPSPKETGHEGVFVPSFIAIAVHHTGRTSDALRADCVDAMGGSRGTAATQDYTPWPT